MFSDQEDMSDEELYNNMVIERRPKTIRQRPNHFNVWDDSDFYNRFRLSKNSANMILQLIGHHIQHPTHWNNALTPDIMLLVTLRLFATGCMLITAGDFSGISKSTTCQVVKNVSHHIAMLRGRFIQFPGTNAERLNIRQKFYSIARFPRVIGALDCTHVKITSPGGENPEVFRNRKGFFSFNVQTVCDPDLKILDIVARWPGSSHDSTIFNNSAIRARFENGNINDGSLLVADSGYQNRNYIITPLLQVNSPEENLFNESQIRTRNCVERSYGVWKRRFPILALGIRFGLEKAQCVIVATAVLHNICCINNEFNIPQLEEHLENAIILANNVHTTVILEMKTTISEIS